MGPLIGNYIDTEFNYLLAVLIGILFGYILEQAGFSTSKKLAGLFYGYDFVVLRVFFTAAVTASLGVIFMEHFGLIDGSVIYINSTYVWPIIIGGIIMGLGFILGGFCPGTSIAALSIGKIDAMVFFAGLVFGAFVFVEAFSFYEVFFDSTYLGELLVYESLGMSRGWFTVLFVLVALVSFAVTYIIEQKINKKPLSLNVASLKQFKNYGMAAVATVIITGAVAFMPARADFLFSKAENIDIEAEKSLAKHIDAQELAYRVLEMKNSVSIIDLRSSEEYIKSGLPNSVNIPYASLMNRGWEDILDNSSKRKLLIANDEITELKAQYICKKNGYKNFYILKGGFDTFNNKILNVDAEDLKAYSKDNADFIRKASVEIQALIANSKKVIVKPKMVKKVKGGC